jgi:tetratricopeptide (TPR) repeat protein
VTNTSLLTLDPWHDRLTVQEYGTVWDGQPPSQTRVLSQDERVGFLLDEPDGERFIAAMVDEPFDLDPRAIEAEELWDAPRFFVPMLGPEPLSVGDILLLIQARYTRDEPTNDALHFHSALASQEDGDRGLAIAMFKLALEAGDLKGHYGLGYLFLEDGHPREAAEHLRIYTDLTPHNAWAWCWLGKAHAALGEIEAARIALRRAIDAEAASEFETDAADLLDGLNWTSPGQAP